MEVDVEEDIGAVTLLSYTVGNQGALSKTYESRNRIFMKLNNKRIFFMSLVGIGSGERR